jgi:hypothetical protein
LPHNDLSVNVEIEDSFNKCSMTSFSLSQSRGIIFNLRSNLLTSKFLFRPLVVSVTHSLLATSAAPLDCDQVMRRHVDT